MAEMDEKLGSGVVRVGFVSRQSGFRNERRVADLDGRKKKSSAWNQSLAKRRSFESETCRAIIEASLLQRSKS